MHTWPLSFAAKSTRPSNTCILNLFSVTPKDPLYIKLCLSPPLVTPVVVVIVRYLHSLLLVRYVVLTFLLFFSSTVLTRTWVEAEVYFCTFLDIEQHI